MPSPEPTADVRYAALTLPGDAEAPRVARRFVERSLRSWGFQRHIDDASLAASELVTNALLHAGDPHLAVRATAACVRLEVHDPSAVLPVRAADGDASMTGRGLAIVESVADRWGVERAAVGKVVWVEFGPPAAFFATSAASETLEAGGGDGESTATLSTRPVVLHAIPARLVLASNSHLDDLLREFRLMTDEARAALPVGARGLVEAFAGALPVRTGSEEARAALDRGEAAFDLGLHLQPDRSTSLLHLDSMLDLATEEVRAGRLLTPVPHPEVVAFRRWLTHEITRQLAGRPPSPCPFEPEPPEWDAASAEEVRLREARYRSLIEAGELDVWRASATGELLSDMPEWRSHTGQASGDVLGAGWLDAVHPDHRERVAATWQSAVDTEGVYHCEYPIVGADGSIRQIIARAAPVREGGIVREWVGTTVDVTDQRNAEHELAAQAKLVETLHDIGTKLATTLDLDALLKTLVEATTRITGAQLGAFFFNRVDERGQEYQLVTLHGATTDDFAAYGMPRNTAIFGPTFDGERPVRHADVMASPDYGLSAPHHGMPPGHPPVRSYLAVPVHARDGGVHGGLFFGHSDVGVFNERDERAVVAIAAQAAVAIENALLLDAERRARAVAEEANRRQALLADAMERLGASLDVDSVLTTLARLVVPAPAAWSVVTIVDANGAVELAAAAGEPPRDYERHGRRFELRTKEAAGATLFIGNAPGHAFDADDLAVVGDVALRAAVAVDNALLYSQQRDAALTLQQALLPRELPSLRDLDYAIRYLPATSGSRVGGDFYDIALLDQTHVAISVGDVQGKGVRAAAHMGQVRAAASAYTHAGLGPGAVLQFLDRMWEQQSDVLVTYLLAQFDLSRGTGRIATAGHLPPLRFGGGRAPSYVEVRPGPPIGAAGGVYLESMLTIPPGAGIVLFTDGLVEHRKRAIDDGLEALRVVVERAAGGGATPEEMAEQIVGSLLADGHDDDVALIVVQRRA